MEIVRRAIVCFLFLTAAGCKTQDSGSTANESALESSTVNEEFQETPIPNESEEIVKSIELVRKKILDEVSADGQAHRDAHPKTHGCVNGTFEVLANGDPRTRVGMFASPKKYPFYARVSNAGLVAGNRDDRVPDARGIAIRLFGVPGEKLLPSASSSQDADLLFVNAKVFVADDVAEYNRQLADATTVLRTRGTVLAALLVQGALKDPFFDDFHSVSPYQLGNKAVKYRLKPCEGAREFAISFGGPNYIRDSMKKRLNSTGACLDVEAQFYVNEDVTPIEKGTKEWKESSSPFVTFARIDIPAQAFDSQDQQNNCENTSFNPWRVPEGHRPLGSLNRARLEVYKASSSLRLQHNKSQEFKPN